MPPWTQRIVLDWRPELRYWEVRTRILRQIEDRGELNAFRITNEDVRGLLFGGGCELIIRPDQLDLMINTPALDPGRCWEVAAEALRAIGPSRPTEIEVLMHHIIGLEQPERDPAIAVATERLFSLPSIGTDVSVRDWALLCDLEVAGSTGTDQMEFGILGRNELPARLLKNIGRNRHRVNRAPPARTVDLDLDAFPSVALFVDSSWTAAHTDAASFVDAALEFWARSRDRADEVAQALHTRVVGEQKEQIG